MLSAWSVLLAAFAIVASAAPNQYSGNYGQKLQKTVVAAPALVAADQSYGSYEATTPAAEPVTRAAYGSYQAPAIKKVLPVARIEKPSYGSYQAPAAAPTTRLAALTTPASYGYQPNVLAAEPIAKSYGYQAPAVRKVQPVSHIEQASYGSYQAPAFEPTTRLPIKTIVAAEQSYDSYQAPAVKRVLPVSHIEKASYGSYQAPVAEPTIVRPMKKIAATLPRQSYGETILAEEPMTPSYQQTLAEDETTTLGYGFELGSAPVIRSVFSNGYDNVEMPAAEPVARAAYGSYQAPAIKKVLPVARIEKPSYGSYQAPAAAPIRLAALTTPAYGYQAPAFEPTTILSAYGSKKIIAAAPIKKIVAAAAPY